jgi:hypothetical protein
MKGLVVLAGAAGMLIGSTAMAVDVGPDSYGYTGTEIDYFWEDISGFGTEFTLGDDDHLFVPGAIGFNFNFYGLDYTDIGFQSNGALSFFDGYVSLANQAMPTATYGPMIATFWDDLDPGGVYPEQHLYYATVGTAGVDLRFIVSYINVPHYPDGNQELNTFQTILYEDGSIVMNYMELTQDPPGGGSWSATIGIQGDDGVSGLDGLTWAHDDNGPNMPASMTSILWTPSPGVLALLGLAGLARRRRR